MIEFINNCLKSRANNTAYDEIFLDYFKNLQIALFIYYHTWLSRD